MIRTADQALKESWGALILLERPPENRGVALYGLTSQEARAVLDKYRRRADAAEECDEEGEAAHA